jgi:PPOX class probable F420-dependent enzyme
MELHEALSFAAGQRNALLTTLRRDGRPQQSMIFYVQDGAQFTISLTDTRAKVRNLRRDPRASLFIPSDDVFQWVTLDGTVTLSQVTSDPDDAVADALVDYYRRTTGEHSDWAEYRQAMVDEGRLVATFHAISANGILPH